MILAPFVSIGGLLRFPLVSLFAQGWACFVSHSFPARFPSFLVSHPIPGKRETKLLWTALAGGIMAALRSSKIHRKPPKQMNEKRQIIHLDGRGLLVQATNRKRGLN